jgi:hypothetical protein
MSKDATQAAVTSASMPDKESAYRHYLADTILEYITDQGAIDGPEAYRQVIAVTGRQLSTVKNWLSYRTNLPDLASLARIVEHWAIPTTAIFPPQLSLLLSGVTMSDASAIETPRGSFADHVLVPLYGAGDAAMIDRALAKYTDHPKSALLVRHEGSDMLDEIRPGELMLVDTTLEQIRGSGIYLLKFAVGGEQATCVRHVDLLMGEPAVRIRGGSASPATSAETLPLVEGVLREVTVLGRVVGVLRQT